MTLRPGQSGDDPRRRAFHIPCCILLMKTIIFVIGVLKEGKEGGWKREEGGRRSGSNGSFYESIAFRGKENQKNALNLNATFNLDRSLLNSSSLTSKPVPKEKKYPTVHRRVETQYDTYLKEEEEVKRGGGRRDDGRKREEEVVRREGGRKEEERRREESWKEEQVERKDEVIRTEEEDELYQNYLSLEATMKFRGGAGEEGRVGGRGNKLDYNVNDTSHLNLAKINCFFEESFGGWEEGARREEGGRRKEAGKREEGGRREEADKRISSKKLVPGKGIVVAKKKDGMKRSISTGITRKFI